MWPYPAHTQYEYRRAQYCFSCFGPNIAKKSVNAFNVIFLLICLDLFGSNLSHNAKHIGFNPMFGNSTILDAEDMKFGPFNRSAGGGNTEEFSFVGGLNFAPHRNFIPFRNQSGIIYHNIGKACKYCLSKTFKIFDRAIIADGRVIPEIGRKYSVRH